MKQMSERFAQQRFAIRDKLFSLMVLARIVQTTKELWRVARNVEDSFAMPDKFFSSMEDVPTVILTQEHL